MIFNNPVARKNILLSRLEKKEISKDDFLKECYFWTFEPEVWMDIDILNYPDEPQEWQEYQKLSFKERYKISDNFFQQSAIKEFIQQKDKAYAHNKSDLDWLTEIRNFLPEIEENSIYHKKLDEKILIFKSWFNNSSLRLDKAREVFNATEAY